MRWPRWGWRPGWPPRRGWWWALGGVAFVVALAYAAAFMLDEPMRRSMERRLNASLKGYEVTLGRLDFHPFGFSLDLENLTIRQQSNPEPPVAHIPRLSASVEWRQLIRARLVAEIEIARPMVNVNLKNLREEAKDPTPVEDKGWQEALEQIYPLKINLFTITDAEIVYTDEGPFKPRRLWNVNFLAENIRNVRSPERTYPSKIWAGIRVFDHGRLEIDGHADFLADPHPGVLANVKLEGIELDYFKPVTRRLANITMKGGELAAEGNVEYGPAMKAVDLRHAEVTGVDVEYTQQTKGTAPAKKAAGKVERATAEVAEKPGTLVKIAELNVTRSRFALVNAATTPPYRLFLSDLAVKVRNITNQSEEGVGDITLTGRFMGSGPTTAKVRYRPATPVPDVAVNLAITDADMAAMNDLWRAYGGFDVTAGDFSFFSELRIKDGMLSGYVKPLMRNMEVYDPEQDKPKGVVRRAYEAVVGAVSSMLENRPRDEVATRVEISGRVDNPDVSPVSASARLIQNAFIKAILPGFERRPSRGR
jgi:Domain of Unknown Function (DUF748)